MATETIKSVGSSGRDYATLALWEAARQGDLVAGNLIETAELYADSIFTNCCTFAGWTTNDTNYIKVTVPASQRHAGKWTAAKQQFYLEGGVGAGFNVLQIGTTNPGRVILEWMQFSLYDTAGIVGNFGGLGLEDVTIRNCIAKKIDHWSEGFFISLLGASYILNNTLYYLGGDYAQQHTGIDVVKYRTANIISNNTIYGFQSGINNNGSSYQPYVKNNICMGCATDFAGSAFDASRCSNNMSSDATAPGANSLTSKTASNQFVDVANFDLHLKAGADALLAGVDLGNTWGVNNDIDNYDRDAVTVGWDIGSHQLSRPAAGGDFKTFSRGVCRGVRRSMA